jgi:hypothetical protein
MRKMLMIAVALLALPVLAHAQGACVDVAGAASISPPLKVTPVASGTFTFGSTAPGTCGGASVWNGITSSGTLMEPSCNGNVHKGTTNGGAAFQGVCVGNTCDGGSLAPAMGGSHSMAYQLVFDAATVQAALAQCNAAGLSTASFIGAYESQAVH